METAYLASISTILQKEVCYWWKEAIGWPGICSGRAQNGELMVLASPPLLMNSMTQKKAEPLLLPACPAKWGQPEGGCEGWFYQDRSFEMPTRPGCIHREMEGQDCCNGKLGTVWIIYFSLSVLFPAKTWHRGVSELTLSFKGGARTQMGIVASTSAYPRK